MHRLQTVFATLALVAGSSLVLAAQGLDVQGTWVGVVNLPATPNNPDGQRLPFIAHLTQKGELVSGLLDGILGTPDVPISNGKVSGNTLTFTGVRQINGQDVTFSYTVTPTDGGGLHFAITRAGAAPLESNTTRLTSVP
jgi:hypothetical protein